ncbi:hypothetical protein KKC88_06625 [Patescibacteria group bacterium]|nr:hypothetical protein [Patescibacteria group bacterium]MBU1673148.1 hypothetical protein [Patescibacteria group bacterium]MBU1963396.1 hypothetical protein [Patescibacteria group bacterium]
MYTDNSDITTPTTRRRIVEVTDDFLRQGHSRNLGRRTRSQREILQASFQHLQQRLRCFDVHPAVPEPDRIFIRAFCSADVSRDLDQLEEWVSQGRDLLDRTKTAVSEYRRLKAEAEERELWCNRLENFQFRFDRYQRENNWEGIASLYHDAYELYKRGLEQIETLAVIDEICRELDSFATELALMDEYGNWSDRFLAAEVKYRDFIYYARNGHGTPHRKGPDPDRRRDWRREQRRLNSRWGV